jgi:Flp pilus assembly protein protease CpaA
MVLAWLLALIAVVAALVIGDIRRRTLDNRLILTFTVLAGLAPFLSAGAADRASLPTALVAGLVAFVVGLSLYGLRLVAAGDVKVVFGVAAVVTWFGSVAWLVYLGCVIAVGAATVWWLFRRRGLWPAGSAAQPDDGEPGQPAVAVPLGPLLLVGVVPAVAVALGPSLSGG